MRRVYCLWLVLCLFTTGAWAGKFTPARENGVRDVYLVTLADGVAKKKRHSARAELPAVAEVARKLGQAHGGQILEVWEDALTGFVIRMPEARARALANDPRVKAVEQDELVVSTPVGDCAETDRLGNSRSLPNPSPAFSPQTLQCTDPDPQNDTTPGSPICRDNWGLDRIDQASVSRDAQYHYDNNGRNGTTTVHVYIMDTGVLATHDEFKDASGVSRIGAGANAMVNPVDDGSDGTPPDLSDCISNGHGTHVAAIIGGRTYGVAKDVVLHPVKTACSTSINAAVRGLNWIAAHHISPAVVNWSGGNIESWASNTSLNDAVQGLLAEGVVIVQAAGNQSASDDGQPGTLKDACTLSFGATSPAVVVVGGSDENDGRWTRRAGDPLFSSYCPSTGTRDCGSNTGACIDLWAPAAHVVSASRDGNDKYCRLSGTSMAAPHVTGAVALYLEDHPNATVTEVVNALRSQGTWGALETSSSDPNWIGSGSDNVLLFSRISAVGSDVPPAAAYTFSCSGRKCSFNAGGSSDDFGIASYQWNFGDGTATGSGVTVSHTFAANSSHRVLLTVTDTLGRTDNFSQNVSVGADTAPVASFTVVCSNRICSFNASGSTDDSAIASYAWTFGDGGTGSGATPSHTYASTAFFSVTLTVTDDIAQTGSVTQSVGASIFADVPPNHAFRSFIEALHFAGITSGCGTNPLIYCPSNNITRGQIAVFLLLAKEGSTYTPPAATCSPLRFSDVPCTDPLAPWIEELADRGVTSGCGGGNYCPNNAVTRGQMAVFLLATKEGSGFTPPAATCPGVFGDVSCTDPLASWIEELADRGITGGCGGGNYCPNDSVTRGQMAVFLVSTFGIPVP